MAEPIDDGHTCKGIIPAIPEVCNQIEFEYRPLTARESTRLWNNFQTMKADEKFDKQRDAIISHLISWSMDKPISIATFETIEGPIFEGLIAEISRLGERFRPATAEKN